MANKTKINKPEAISLRNEGWTYKALAKHFGVTSQAIHSAIGAQVIDILKRRHYIFNRYRKQKIRVLTHYGGGKLACVQCGFSDIRALSIDHIAGEGYRDRRGNLYCRLIRQNFPPGYQTLCMNCQLIKRFENNENRKKS